MRKAFLYLASGTAITLALILGLTYFTTPPTEAQKSVTSAFEYAVITGTYRPYPADSASLVSGAAQICYLQQNGCQNVEVRSELILSKFVQDERLENNSRVGGLAVERVSQMALSKAISRLGTEGWEMITSPAVEFDLYYLNQQGITTVKEGNKTDRQHIWFKRARQ